MGIKQNNYLIAKKMYSSYQKNIKNKQNTRGKKFYNKSCSYSRKKKSILDLESDDIFVNQNPIVQKIMELDNQKMCTFQEQFQIDEDPRLCEQQSFLYHALRYKDWLNNLEGIFEKKKILAGKYIDDYMNYSDNCNDGEYVSLARYEYTFEFQTIVGNHVCLIVSPFIEAYQTIYLSFDEWIDLKKSDINVENRYSYMHNEYQVRDCITLDMVRAIGIPYFNLIKVEGIVVAENIMQQIIDLMNQYNILLPIVDIDRCNKVLYDKSLGKVKRL